MIGPISPLHVHLVTVMSLKHMTSPQRDILRVLCKSSIGEKHYHSIEKKNAI